MKTRRISLFLISSAIKHLQIGNRLWESASFNNRLQVTQLGLGASATDTSQWKLDYDFGTTDNNGNIKAQVVTSPAGQMFERLQTATKAVNEICEIVCRAAEKTKPSNLRVGRGG